MIKLLSLVFLLTGVVSARAGSDPGICEKFSPPMDGGYCVHRPEAVRNPDIVYYLHGSGGSEETWGETYYYPAQLRAEWRRRKMEPPTVISISFGETWLLAQKNSSPKSGLFEFVTEQLIPDLEKKLGGLKGRRLLLGDSMGGFNALQLALKTMQFRKAAALCAPMAELTPFASPEQIRKYAESTGAWQYYKGEEDVILKSVNRLVHFAREYYPTPAEWELGDILTLARRASGRVAPHLYLAAGFYDRYAAYEGNQKLAQVLTEQGVSTDWRPQWGGHCAVDIPSLAEFLVK